MSSAIGIGIVMNYQDVKQQVQEFCDEHRFQTYYSWIPMFAGCRWQVLRMDG